MFIISVNNLKTALPKLKEEANMETYVYKKDGMYIYLDNQGNEIAQKDFEEMESSSFPSEYMVSILIDGHEANLGVAYKDGKIIIINSQGEEMFTICNLFDDKLFVALRFMDYISIRNILGVSKTSPTLNNYYRNENNLQKYTELTQETTNLFEDNENDEYMYFKNEDMLLQVVIKNNTRLHVYFFIKETYPLGVRFLYKFFYFFL